MQIKNVVFLTRKGTKMLHKNKNLHLEKYIGLRITVLNGR